MVLTAPGGAPSVRSYDIAAHSRLWDQKKCEAYAEHLRKNEEAGGLAQASRCLILTRDEARKLALSILEETKE
ncbi:hypothetical protein BHAOGJBA_3467 [Methylobacterium hispanicum]|jgi:hypothetical protein|uniref:Lysozyme inhibitor LprI N-terminal domain-containing protein n=1 Tax=Methylobacterium hispanicum TaxID=270350 RepID=A0AAV4ZNQ5_9HYPH|nr:hypothetical protein BHAOGJBA_3467 [Methylobacterium hispanicum]